MHQGWRERKTAVPEGLQELHGCTHPNHSSICCKSCLLSTYFLDCFAIFLACLPVYLYILLQNLIIKYSNKLKRCPFPQVFLISSPLGCNGLRGLCTLLEPFRPDARSKPQLAKSETKKMP